MDLADIRAFCLSLPGVNEDIKWEHHLCFNVGKKMFVITSPDEVPVTASLKVSEEEFQALITRPGISPASYMAKHHWIQLDDIARFTRKEWKHYAAESHRLVASRLSKAERKRLGLEVQALRNRP